MAIGIDLGEESPADDERIARHLRETVLKQVRGDIDERVKRDFPSDRFFAGALAPGSEDQLDDPDDDLQSKMEPSGLGATVRVRGGNNGDALILSINASVWVRVNPTYDEMVNRDSFVALGDRDADDEGDSLLPVFERISLDVPPIEIPAHVLQTPTRDTPEIVQERTQKAFEEAFSDARTYARENYDLYVETEDDDTVPTAALEDEESFHGYLSERTAEGTPALPEWHATLAVEVIADEENNDDSTIVDFEIANEAVQNREDAIYTVRDPTLFEVNLELQTSGDLEFVPFTFDPLPEDFRYNRDLWGHGRNCTITAPNRNDQEVNEEGVPPGRRAPAAMPTATKLETQYIPEYRQLVYESADRDVDAAFETLADLDDGGLALLDDIATEMRRYLNEEYNAALEQYRKRDDWNDDPVTGDLADFNEDRDAFEREIKRFERGIQCLRQHPETVGRAFELMNEAMDRMHEFSGWRLFQLVFIIMEIPDVASREYDEWSEVSWRNGSTEDRAEDADSALDIVDVLWFPTGGGKTEAFLGVAVWSMFFDRLRGKNFGVTAWTKFPLRLLSLQQFQRMTETVMYADLVRREQSDIGSHPSRPFSMGYLVGKANTPNALTGYDNNNHKRYQGPSGENLRREAKVVPSCPACGSDIEVQITEDDHRLTHCCTASSFDCPWQSRSLNPSEPYGEEELPVHVVDNELYRYAPTIIAGTIDKITAIGYQRKFAHLITGEMDLECPIHGFASLGECTEKYGCPIDKEEFSDMARPVEPYDPAPSLMVPDELHLLEESMGSFDGHYETGVAELQDLVEAGKTKVIAPTATITGFEDQVHNLFMRPAERFPSPGPYLRENFYAQERAETQRYYIGLVPHGKTHINSIIDLLFYYHREIQNLFREALDNPKQVLTGTTLEGTDTTAPLEADSIDEVLALLSYYSTSITYLLSKKDGDRLDQSIVSQLDAYLQKDGRPPLASERMTGGTGFETIMEVLDIVEDPWDEDADKQILNRLIDRGVLEEDISDSVLSLRSTLEDSLDEENEVVDSDQFETERADASEDSREALAWLLASRLNTITATNMIAHGVDVDRFNMMTFFGMPRGTAEYIQASSRAGRSRPGLVFNVAHPIRERDLSHYHFFEKYHAFLDRLVEPVPINRWAKNSVKQTHPGLFMGLILNHYMYQEGAGNLYFGDNAEEFADSVDEGELRQQMLGMFGDPDDHEEFKGDIEDLTREALSQLRLDDDQWTSGRIKRSPMRSLRDVDEQLPIRSEYRYREIFETLDNR
ncbi:helicase-related protein [Halorubrum sp. Ea8]|uniref:helicase-related protein n=1 Tax=Halorubrum sp. Ea8 TaxID=1383841 RepID=UPI000B9932E0|nr:helicase-related protein [Halorubrum sp. Ea8]OYR45126.1 helicase [Halorubrum sp. Ea8]